MIAGIADGDGIALCQLDLNVEIFGTYRVILLKRCRQQCEAVAVSRDSFPDASYQMPVRREFAAGDDLLQPIHDLVKLGYEGRDLGYGCHGASFWMVAISVVAFICEAAPQPHHHFQQ